MVDQLNNEVWATLKPSPIHGIGVFAIRDIPKGTLVTTYSVHNRKHTLISVSEEEFELIIKEIRDIILDRTTFVKGQTRFTFLHPNCEQTLQSFINHSSTPNVTKTMITLRDIQKGEELTEDYTLLGEWHKLTQDHYNKIHIMSI